MAFTSPPPAPQRGDRATFSSRMDAFLIWLVGLVGQLNAFLASLTTLAAGGANTFSFIFDGTTADGDPGTGKVRLGSSSQNGSVVMRLDSQAASGGDISNFLAALQAGTSNVKGSVRLQKVADTSSWLLFDITNVATASGYFNLTLTPRGSSTVSPFAANDTLIVFFDRKGDRGDSGGTPTQQQIRDAVGTLPIVNGGTGGTTAEVARQNLGVKAAGTEPIATGGTGATTAAQALGNLGGMPATGGKFLGPIVVPSGTAQRPALTFGDDNTTGFYWVSDGVLGISCKGVLVAKFSANGIETVKITQTQV